MRGARSRADGFQPMVLTGSEVHFRDAPRARFARHETGMREKRSAWLVRWFASAQVRTTTLFIVWVALGLVFYMGHQKRTLPDAIYGMVQIITTVGYGDMTATNDVSRLLSAMYVLVAVLVLSSLVAQFSDHLVQAHSSHTRDAVETMLHPVALEEESTVHSNASRRCGGLINAYLSNHELRAFFRSVFVWTAIVIIGTVFFSCCPGENKTAAEAFYMSVVTLTTVGFGDVTPSTEKGKTFATVWILVGCAAYINMAGSLSKLTMAMSHSTKELTQESLTRMFDSHHVKATQQDRIRRSQQELEERIRKLDCDLSETAKRQLLSEEAAPHKCVGRSDFILHCLLDMNIVDQCLVERMSSDFDMLDRDRTGYLDDQDLVGENVRRRLTIEMQRRKQYCDL